MVRDLAASHTALPDEGKSPSPRSGQSLASPQPTESPEPAVPAQASVPIAIPDPPGSDVHQVGSTMEVAGALIRWDGLFDEGGQLVARFDVMNGSLPAGAQLLTPDGTLLALPAGMGLLQSAPFGDASAPPAPDATLTLLAGDRLYVLAAGSSN